MTRMSLPSMADAEPAEIAAALEMGRLPVAAMPMPTQVIERPVSLLAQVRVYLLGAPEPVRG